MSFWAINKSGRNMRKILTPRQLGADWPRAHPAERESSQLPARVTNTFSATTFSSNFLGSGFQNPDSLQSNTYVVEKLRKCPSINCSRFFLYSRFLRRLILIHNKPVEIPPVPSPPT